MRVIFTAFSPRPLPHCFRFRPRFSFRAAESLTLRSTQEKTRQETASNEANQTNNWMSP